MLRKTVGILLLVLFLPACTGAGTATLVAATEENVVASPTSLPIAPLASVTPTQQAGASLTPVPTLTFPTPFVAATIQPSPTPQLSPAYSAAAIQILAPGPMSKVVSPIGMRGYVIPGVYNMVTTELYGEDGRLIFRKLMRLYSEYKWAYFSLDIPFETNAAAELGRLQISTEDESGTVTALMSVHLLLQSEGFDEINPPGDLGERVNLLTPLPGMEASGGVLSVGGAFRPFNTQPLIIELISMEGAILSSKWVSVPAAAEGSPLLFGEELIYSVEAPTQARLVVRQFDERINGNMYLFMQRLLVNP